MCQARACQKFPIYRLAYDIPPHLLICPILADAWVSSDKLLYSFRKNDRSFSNPELRLDAKT